MRRYFINPEIKRSTIILMTLIILFLFFTLFITKLHHDRLKNDYIKSIGAIASRVIEKNPELEKEIMPFITKEISEKEALKGTKLLKEYGLDKNLEDELFPYIRRTIIKNNYAILFIFVIMAGILFIFNYIQYGFFYERIRKLTIGAKKVIEGEYDISINEEKEGDFSKLAVSFNDMRKIIRNNLNELNKEKQFLVDLLSDISHQLKTPLSSMILYNDILLNKDLSKKQRKEFLLNNQNQLNRMEWLIKSMLKLAKFDANAIMLNKEEKSLNETLQVSIETLESKSLEGNVEIYFNEKETVVLNHDQLWLEEAFINIIKNGIEHTKDGGKIHIGLNENPIYKRVTIEDSGEGISDMDLPNIFKRFYKAKTSKKSDSIGIGLALAKSIVESHGGVIEAQSTVGVGTKFIITFLKY